MSRYEIPEAVRHDAHTLAEDTRALIEATAETADEKVTRARQRLTEAARGGKLMYARFQDRAGQSVRTADHTVREHPYQTALGAFALGVMLGLLMTRRSY